MEKEKAQKQEGKTEGKKEGGKKKGRITFKMGYGMKSWTTGSFQNYFLSPCLSRYGKHCRKLHNCPDSAETLRINGFNKC